MPSRPIRGPKLEANVIVPSVKPKSSAIVTYVSLERRVLGTLPKLREA